MSPRKNASHTMPTQKTTALDVAVPFDVREMIFSTTDKKGIIRSVNDTFLTMARYSLGEVLGKPHSLVRHPQMPKAAFGLYWDYIGSGKSVGVYVTNRASDGAYYKVYTLATPLKDGYLAIRFKTTGKTQSTIDRIYKRACDYEAEQAKLGVPSAEYIKGSSDILLGDIKELGFETYDEFMISTLVSEMQSRDGATREIVESEVHDTSSRRTTQPRGHDDHSLQMIRLLERGYQLSSSLFNGIGSLLGLQEKLHERAAGVNKVSKLFEMSSINVSLESTRMGEEAVCLSVIATHLSESSQRICELAESMTGQIKVVSGSLGDAAFRIAAVRLQIETMLDYCKKAGAESADESEDAQRLQSQFPHQCIEITIADLLEAVEMQRSTLGPTMQSLITDLRKLEQNLASVKRAMLSLRFAQLGGKIESSRLGDSSVIGTLVETIGTEIVKTVKQISDLESDLHMAATGVESSFREIDSLNRAVDSFIELTQNKEDKTRSSSSRVAA